MPTTATLAFLASASIFFASARFLPTGYDSSSVVDTIATFFLSTASICGITFLSDELVHSTATSGLPLLIAPTASLVMRTLQFLVEADHLAEVETDLRAIDVDGADNLKPLARGDLARHRRTDRTQAHTSRLESPYEAVDYIPADRRGPALSIGKRVTMNAGGRQKPTPPTRPAGRSRTRGRYLPLSCTFLRRSRLDPAPAASTHRAPRRQPARRRPRQRTEAAAGESPRTANYDIDVTLDPATRTLTGSEVITWRNPGAVAAYSIRLHLYWNAFRNTNSTWLKQRHLAGDNPFAWRRAGRLRLHQRHQADASSTPTAARADLTEGLPLHLARRSERATIDRWPPATLADAVQPGETLRLRVAWTGKFPRNFDRTGAIGNYFFVSQWFPKLGVFEPAAGPRTSSSPTPSSSPTSAATTCA